MAIENIAASDKVGDSRTVINSNFSELDDRAFDNVYQGWAQYTDGQYTEGSPFTVNQGVTASLPNNAASSIETYLDGDGSLYNGTVITPWEVGDRLAISVRFKIKNSNANGGVILKLDIGGSQGIILEDTRRLIRGSGTESRLSFEMTPYCLSTFIANGGTLKVESVDGNSSIYDINYVIGKIN